MNKNQGITKVKDHAVSGEFFELVPVDSMEMLETTPRPLNLEKYYESQDYISHTDSRRNWFEWIYQAVRSKAIRRKLKLISNEVAVKGELLDFGCGTGDFLSKAYSEGWNITGVEPNSAARNVANQKTGNAVLSIEEFDKSNQKKFDVITLWLVLEHLDDPVKWLSNFKALLKNEGVLIIAVPNHKSFDAGYYKSFWAAYDVPRHLWHFSKQSIHKLSEQCNLKLEKISPMHFDAYYVSLLSEKYKSGWMNIFNAFFIATRSNLKASGNGEYSSLIYVLKHS